MEQDLFDDLVESLEQAVAYAKGDKTKGRSTIIEVPDELMQFYSAYGKLSEPDKSKAMNYVNDLLHSKPVQA